MSDIFISYASEDRPRAQMLAQILESQGWSTFWDRTIPISKTWREVIEKQLNEARCVIVIWSKSSIGSKWVQEEAEEGQRRGILFPALIENVLPPIGFRSIQAADLSDWDTTEPTQAVHRLIADIAGLIGLPPKKAEEKPERAAEAIYVRSPAADNAAPATVRGSGGAPARNARLLKAAGISLAILLVIGFAYQYLPRTASEQQHLAPTPTPTSPPRHQRHHRPPPPPPKYTIQQNLDLYGEDIVLPDGQVGIAAPNIEACTARCDSNKSCVALSFDRWRGQCYLKNKIVAPLLDPRSVVGLKEGFELPAMSKAPIEMEVVRNHRFSGQPSMSKSVSDFQACRDACTSYVNCIAFSFLKAAGTADNCQFFRGSEKEYVDDASADSGYKHQSAQAAPLPPPSTESVIARFAFQQNRDINGQDISDGRISGLDINGCALRCDSNKSCVAFSLDNWNHECYLKSGIVTSRLDPHSTIAVKKPYKLPDTSNGPIRMVTERARSHRFGGQPQKSTRVTNFDACKAACTDDDQCVAFSFLKNVGAAKNCEIFFVSEEGYFDDSSADSGYKVQ